MCSTNLANTIAPVISMGSQAIGTVIGAVGAAASARSQKMTLEHRARMAEINARVAEGNARNLVRAGVIEESRIRHAGEYAKASSRARMADSGIDIANSSTAIANLSGIDVVTEQDAILMRQNALRAAMGQRFQAVNARTGGAIDQASASSISPGMAGLTTLITGAGQVADSWYRFDKVGAFGSGGVTPSVSTVGGYGDIAIRLPETQSLAAQFPEMKLDLAPVRL